MYEGLSVIAIAPVFNEREKIGKVIERVPSFVDEVLVVDDGSTDGSGDVARNLGASVVVLPDTIGVGAALRDGFEYAVSKDHDIAVVMAGNNKDWPEEIPVLLTPIVEGNADLVQGSRYLHPTPEFGEMPLYRRIATRVHPLLFGLVCGQKMTDTTNGFRAISRAILTDPAMRLDQGWLDEYELEPYQLYKSVKLGYRLVEVPVRKTYPPKSVGQTKMKPLVGWWSILRPLILLGLRIKR